MDDFWLWAYSLPGVGSRTVVRLRSVFSGKKTFAGLISELSKASGSDLRRRDWKDEAGKIFSWMQSLQVGYVPFWDSRYPEVLREIHDCPAFLLYKGNWPESPVWNSVSVVGSRSMTSYGQRCVGRIVQPIVEAGCPVISGLAVGVDSEVLSISIQCGRNGAYPVAVLPGCPPGGFPARNGRLFQDIVTHGLAVWEFLPGIMMEPKLFAVRNRIIAGLSACTVVVESGENGGSLITADLALQYGRDVCAVPGSIFSDMSKGTNALISQGAYPVTSGHDVLSLIGIDADDRSGAGMSKDHITASRVLSLFGVPEEEQRLIQDAILSGDFPVSAIIRVSSKPASEVRGILTRLEVEGILSLKEDGHIILS